MSEKPTQDDAQNLVKIGSFARIAKTNLRTLRYYEELGLLRPAVRSEGGFRYYRPNDVHRVQMIQNLQQLGLQLEQIRDLIGLNQPPQTSDHFATRILSALEEQERLVAGQLRSLQAQQEKIAEAKRKLTECRSCNHCPTVHNNHCDPCQNTGEALPEFLSALF